MNGTFVAVVGPSGVGKDSLIGFARERLEPAGLIHVVRRVVTRLADGGSEDHDSLDEASFAAAEQAGAFALANLSRAMIPALLMRYPDAVVVAVSADRDVIERRLAGRGRETAASIQQRIERRVADRLPASTVRIDNSGALEAAGEQLVQLLEDIARQAKRG